MKQMRQYLTTLGVVWTAACIAAYFYSHQQNIPWSVALVVLQAFLVEIAFYLLPGFLKPGDTFRKRSARALFALLLAVTAVLPYVLLSFGRGTLRLESLAGLGAAALVASFWYIGAEAGLVVDLLFLAFMAGVYLSKLFDHAYGQLNSHVSLAILGKLMWIRLGLLEVLLLRGLEDVKFGFVPSRQDWRVGGMMFAAFLPVGAGVAYLLRLTRFHPQPLVWWKFLGLAVATFLGILWVVALAEEFFFRAFLQQVMTRSLHSSAAGLLAASAIFGLAHLTFRVFPNWRMAAIAAVHGVFCGLAFLKTRSVRASMVTHALVVTTWRMLFSG